MDPRLEPTFWSSPEIEVQRENAAGGGDQIEQRPAQENAQQSSRMSVDVLPGDDQQSQSSEERDNQEKPDEQKDPAKSIAGQTG